MNILYCEDEEIIKEPVLKIFKRRGYNVFYAENGEIGLELYKNNNIDIIITDINMPKLNGDLMLKKIIEEYDYKNKSVIVSGSGNILESTKNFFLKKNIKILMKPVNIEELISIIEKV